MSSTQLQLQPPRPRLSEGHLRAFLKDLADVERLLKDLDLLSGLARLLPRGACLRPTSAPSNLTGPLSNSTWSSNTTDTPREAGEERAHGGGAPGGEDVKEQPENAQFSAFVQLWAGLQPILCGNNR